MYRSEPDIVANQGYRPDAALSGFIDAARNSG
jgi:hypothetical protein